MKELKTLPLYSRGAVEDARLFARQRQDLERRADFVRACLARDRRDGNGQPLDPVLASHLGLSEKTGTP
jgi:hypothetical protein